MRTLTSTAVALLAAHALAAQEHQMGKHDMTGHTMPPVASAKAKQQIAEVQKATEPLASVDGARGAGFMPVLGWIPTMGTHWVNAGRMMTGKNGRLGEPEQLMFSPMNGKQTLVGAAYAYYAALSDSVRPKMFDGDPGWHDHPDLAPPGTDLVMLHVWFVPSPDGAFAGHNPFLPFWGAGLTPPDMEKMHEDAYSLRVRRAALALGEIVDTAGLFPLLARRPAVKSVLDTERSAIRALVPQVDAASKANDSAKFDALLTELGKHWDTIHDAYFASVVRPEARERMVKLVDDMLRVGGGHAH